MTHRSQLSSLVQYLPGPLSNGLDSYNNPFYERASDDFVINPHWLVHTIWGFSQERQDWNNPLQAGWASKFGFPLYTTDPRPNATPVISFAGDLGGCCTHVGHEPGQSGQRRPV